VNLGTFSCGNPERTRPAIGLQRWENLSVYANTTVTGSNSPSQYIRLWADRMLLTDDLGRVREVKDVGSGQYRRRTIGASGEQTDFLQIDCQIQGLGGVIETVGVIHRNWYYLWVVCDESGEEVEAFLSTQYEDPPMPAGFVFKCRCSAVRTPWSITIDGFVECFYQKNNFIFHNRLKTLEELYTGGTGTSGLAWAVLAASPLVQYGTLVPPVPVAKAVRLWLGRKGNLDGHWSVAPEYHSASTPVGVQMVGMNAVSAAPDEFEGFNWMHQVDMPVVADNIYVKAHIDGSSEYNIRVKGFWI